MLILAGCSSRPPLEEPTIKSVPPPLIADSGASLYVLEGPEEWWRPFAEEYGFVNLTGLKGILRHGLSQSSVTLVGHADFQATNGLPTEVTLFNPDSKPNRNPQRGSVLGFRVRLKASTIPDVKLYGVKSCTLEVEAERLLDRVEKTGEVRRDAMKFLAGHRDLSLGDGFVMSCPSTEGREYTLLLRIASLREP